jgi:hypothetical protein
MWTPLLLICYVDSIDCAIPNAPAYMTEEQCLLALDEVLGTLASYPEGMIDRRLHDCYNWGLRSLRLDVCSRIDHCRPHVY